MLGEKACPGDESHLESRPVVQPMIIGRLILKKALESGVMGAMVDADETTEPVPDPPQIPVVPNEPSRYLDTLPSSSMQYAFAGLLHPISIVLFHNTTKALLGICSS